jgi:hypothetical protein
MRDSSFRLALALVLVAAAGAVASAHQASSTYSFVTVAEDRRALDYRLLIRPPDLAEVVDLAPDRDPTDERIGRYEGAIVSYVLARIAVKSGDTACPVEPGRARPVTEGERFVEVSWRVICAGPFDPLVIEYELFFDLDDLHRAFLRVDVPGRSPADAQLRDGEARFVWDLGAPPPSYSLAYLTSGVEHILFGFDHICFLLALLLVIGIERTPSGWAVRDLRSGLRYTVFIVTSFTLAHSLTLISAALGWISAPARIVESMIAASIAYVAIENIIRPQARHRYAITFAFGLVHGLGFAYMLQVMLPPEGVVLPLLLFNLGVELGQLVFVAVALPILWLLARAVGPATYRRRLMPALAAALALLALLWLIERVADISLLGL